MFQRYQVRILVPHVLFYILHQIHQLRHHLYCPLSPLSDFKTSAIYRDEKICVRSWVKIVLLLFPQLYSLALPWKCLTMFCKQFVSPVGTQRSDFKMRLGVSAMSELPQAFETQGARQRTSVAWGNATGVLLIMRQLFHCLSGSSGRSSLSQLHHRDLVITSDFFLLVLEILTTPL